MNTRQQEIIAALDVHPAIDPAREIEARTEFLRDYLARTGVRGFMLGISGGQDSLLAGMLAQRAVELHRKDGFDAEFHAALLPYGRQIDRADAELAIATIQPDHTHDLNIQPAIDAFADSFAQSEGTPLRDFDKGNAKARQRMLSQYALASHHGLVVLGTDHAAEAVTGFFTKYGDGAADVLPLSGLTKRQGRAMLQALGVPEVFITKPPTADLLDARPGQPDEHELGLSYDDIDDFLEGKQVPPHIARKIIARYDATWHKRTMPVPFTRHWTV